jgi:hypothetical protein
MTKPFIPEFTDRAGGLAFIAAGRGRGGLQRPTKDAWNTIVERDVDTVRMLLRNKLIVSWHNTGTDEFVSLVGTSGSLDYTARQRMNAYALNPRGFHIEADASIVGKIAEAKGVPIPGLLGTLRGAATLNPDGSWVGLVGSPGLLDRKLRKAVDDWSESIGAGLDIMTTYSDTQPNCVACSPMGGTTPDASIGRFSGEREHLFAHVFGHEPFSGELLLNTLLIKPDLLNFKVAGSRSWTIGKVELAITKNIKALANVRMRALLDI